MVSSITWVITKGKVKISKVTKKIMFKGMIHTVSKESLDCKDQSHI